MSWSFDPSAWSDGVTIPNAANFQSIAADLHTRGGNVDGGAYGRANTGFLTLTPGAKPGTAYTVTGASWAASVATLTIGAHVIVVGQIVQISSVVPSGYNGTVAITAITGTTISYALTSNPGAYTSGGTALVGGVTAANGMLAVDENGVLNVYAGGSFSPLVTHIGALTASALLVGNGSGDLKAPNSAATLDANGNIVTPGSLSLSGASVTVANGLNSDINIGNRSYINFIGPTGAYSAGGFTGGVPGRLLYVWNSLAQAVTIVNEDASSVAANRIQTLTGANVTLPARTSFMTFLYATNSRWTLVATN